MHTAALGARAELAERRADLASSARGAPAEHRVVLLEGPRPLERALKAALSPWGLRVQSVQRARPGATLPGSALDAAAIAQELGAETLVWLSNDRTGAALWIYEAWSDTIRARPCPDKPLDKALAAALALSVKTWLRSSFDEAEPPPEPEPEVAPVEPAATPSGTEIPESPVVRDRGTDRAEKQTIAARVLIYGGARRGALQPDVFEARYGVELRLSPWRSAGLGAALWLSARFETGEARGLTLADFRGTYTETGGGLGAGLSYELTPVLDVGLQLGASLQRTSLSGTLLATSVAAERSHWPIMAQVRPELELDLGRLGVILQPTLGMPLRQQIYTTEDRRTEVVKGGTLWWMVGGAVRLDVL